MQLSFYDFIGGNSETPDFNRSNKQTYNSLPGTITFIDLFAGIGGMRKGFEMACQNKSFDSNCVFTSEIKPSAVKILEQNNPNGEIYGDITQISANSIPDFDILLAGFPCQAFSTAGKRLGFLDTRGTLFFDVERILKDKSPFGFILENVEGLVTHDKENRKDEIGRTLTVILNSLQNLGYKVSWRVLNAKNFGVPQERKRVYIVGTKGRKPNLSSFTEKQSVLSNVLEKGLPCKKSRFIDLLLSHYPVETLFGRSIKDKRGGQNNIHSWDFELKGSVTADQRELLNLMMRERRKRKWAEDYGIDWMDGMPLTIDHIRTFYECDNLEQSLDDLVVKKYLKKEYPKRKIDGKRIQDCNLPIGYNIIAGKKSYEVSKILDPSEIAPTLVAMDMQHLFVVDNGGLRCLTLREGLRLFGFPDSFIFNIDADSGYDLLGNTVAVPVIESVSEKVIDEYIEEKSNETNASRSVPVANCGRQNIGAARAD